MLEGMQRVEPYVSLVVTARNDDHGGDLLTRMQAFTDGWIEQCNRFSLNSELVIVDWNQVEQRPPLAEALRWPAGNRHCTVRVITVSQSVHKRYRHADALGLYQMIAKNVGIRRARGEFILATNVDILFSNELVEKLAKRDLSKTKMYRIDRYDAMGEIPLNAGIQEKLSWCASHLLRLNAREGTFLLSASGERVPADRDIAARDSGISLEANWFPPEIYEGAPYRWVGTEAALRLRATNGNGHEQLSLDLEPGASTGYGPFLLVVVDEQGKRVAERYVHRRQVVRVPTGMEAGQEKRFTLHVVGGGQPVDDDPRLLNMRVLGVGWRNRLASNGIGNMGRWKWWLRRAYRRWKGVEKTPQAPKERQLAEERTGLTYGAGWGDWERIGQGYGRWIRGEAELTLSSETGWGMLQLDIEQGPDAVGENVRFVVCDEEGDKQGAALLKGRQSFVWKAGGAGRTARTLRVRGERVGGGRALAGERLVLMHTLSWRSGANSCGDAGQLQAIKQNKGVVHLHTNGCGDFTLLAREAWFDLRGYPEFDAFSMNVDSVICWAAHHAGYQEEMFEDPMRIYHIEHGVGSGWTPEGEAKLYERIASKGIPWLDYPGVISWARDMNRFHSPFIFNLDNWGLAEDEFEEREIR